ncbi:MAG: hypothetical protein WCN98_08700 [Verrucomicrobiaceae bacterium]
MKFNRANSRHALSLAHGTLLIILLVGRSAAAQPQSSQLQEKPGFFERASTNIGGFFQRLFNPNDTPPAPPQQQQQQRQHNQPSRSGGPRYNLDTPPSGVRTDSPASTPSNHPSGTKNTGATTKTTSGQHSTTTEKEQAQKPKNPATLPEKKEVAVKNTAPVKKPTSESKTSSKSSGDTARTVDTKPGGKTESTTLPKLSQEQNLLTGSKTSKAGRVKSPYPPYNELDVSGLATGSLALDPTTQKVFRVP